MTTDDENKSAPWYAHVGEGRRGSIAQHSVCSGTGDDRGDENDHACVAMAYGRDEADARAVAERIASDHNDAAALRAERDLHRAALAAAATGEALRCDTCHGGVLATMIHADCVAACDACAKGDGWTDAPHAEAIRGALKATEGGR